MLRLDMVGFGLLRQFRVDLYAASLLVILLSSRPDEVYRLKGIDTGSDTTS